MNILMIWTLNTQKKLKKNRKRISPNNNNSIFEILYGDEDINITNIKINEKKKDKLKIK